jgi:hypothetical protein
MTIYAHAGPQVIFPDAVNNANPELGPSLLVQGSGLLDPRPFYTYAPGQNFGEATAGWLLNSRISTLYGSPITLSNTIIAAAAHTVGGTPMTLATTTTSGIAAGVKIVRADTGVLTPAFVKLDPQVMSVTANLTLNSNIMTVTAVGMVLTDSTTAANLPTGTYITGWASNGGGTGVGGLGTYTLSAPAAATVTGDTVTGIFANLYANGVLFPTVPFGQAGTIQMWNQLDMISRAVSITSTGSQVVQNFVVRGFDIYGYPMTETITTVGTTAITTNGKKAFKYIQSVTPSVTDAAGSYSVGTQDIIGFPLRTENFTVGNEWDNTIVYNGAVIGASTGYTAAVLTTPTATTGDVRGTYTLQSASNGTKVLQISQTPQLAAYGSAIGLFGQPQYADF